jgi:hypothetical protein
VRREVEKCWKRWKVMQRRRNKPRDQYDHQQKPRLAKMEERNQRHWHRPFDRALDTWEV